LEKHELCGDIAHKIFVNDKEIDMRTMPVAFDKENMDLYMYSESRSDIGLRKLRIKAYFVNYPDLVYDDSTYEFNILDNPCAFDELSFVRPGPLQNVTYLFNQDSVVQDFNVNDFVRRKDYDHECGGLVVDFSHYGDEPLLENLFNYTQSSFIVKY